MNACDYLASGSKYEILNGIKDIGSLFDFKTLRKTQILASKTKGDTFLTAPTGSGKTEAALLWSGNNQNPLASKRVFYLLPYTASINAMYTRLKKDFKNPDLVANLHGKASYFLYKTFSPNSSHKLAAIYSSFFFLFFLLKNSGLYSNVVK